TPRAIGRLTGSPRSLDTCRASASTSPASLFWAAAGTLSPATTRKTTSLDIAWKLPCWRGAATFLPPWAPPSAAWPSSPAARAPGRARGVRAGERRAVALGGEESFAALAAARMAADVPAGARPLVVVVPDEPRAIVLARDIDFFLGAPAEGDDERVLHLPAVE